MSLKIVPKPIFLWAAREQAASIGGAIECTLVVDGKTARLWKPRVVCPRGTKAVYDALGIAAAAAWRQLEDRPRAEVFFLEVEAASLRRAVQRTVFVRDEAALGSRSVWNALKGVQNGFSTHRPHVCGRYDTLALRRIRLAGFYLGSLCATPPGTSDNVANTLLNTPYAAPVVESKLGVKEKEA